MNKLISIAAIAIFLSSTASSQIVGTNKLDKDLWNVRIEVMDKVIVLPNEEKIKFRQLYNEYDKSLTKLNNERTKLILEYYNHYDRMTDKKADEFVEKFLAIKDKRSKLNKKYYRTFKKEFGSIIAARFLQTTTIIINNHDMKFNTQLPLIR